MAHINKKKKKDLNIVCYYFSKKKVNMPILRNMT